MRNNINYNNNGKFEKSTAVEIKSCFTLSLDSGNPRYFWRYIKSKEFLCIIHRNCGLLMHELMPVCEPLGSSKQKKS